MTEQSNIPYHLHEFIGKLTTYIEDTITTEISNKFPQKARDSIQINLDILYRNPRMKAMCYLIPLKNDEYLPASSSDFFKYLKGLLSEKSHLLASISDIKPLINLALNSQHTITALQMFRQYPKADEYFSASEASNLRLLTNMFNIFLNLDEETLTELNNYKLLGSVIHILLGILPQFEGAECALMDDKKFDCVKHSRKIKAWEICRNMTSVKSETKLFYLLSVIESLRWWEKSNFIFIGNLYDFLSDDKDSFTFKIRELPLSRLSLYLNCKGLGEKQLWGIEKHLKNVLLQQVDVFIDLVRTFNLATFRRDMSLNCNVSQNYGELVAQGMINILVPDEIEITTQKQDKKIIKKKYVLEKEMTIEEVLNSEWGRYKLSPEITTEEVLDIAGTPFYEDTDTGFIVNHLDRDTSINLLWLNNEAELTATHMSSLFLGDLFANLRILPWQISLQDDHEWYLRAFDEYYYNFDKKRQDELEQMRMHKNDEIGFYSKIIDDIHGGKDSLDIIDIGIGYGRLAKKLLGIEGYQINLSGLDISPKLVSFIKDYMPEMKERIPIYQGEMIEMNDIVGDKLFDIAILAFTTFGCYEKNEKNIKTLESISKSLKPGGAIIIEQFNPHWPVEIKPYELREGIQGERITLLKTTEFVKLPEISNYTLYNGDYFYYSGTNKGKQLSRRDHYSLHLYHQEWFEEKLSEDFETIEFYADFNKEKKYADYNNDARVMICVATKKEEGSTLNDSSLSHILGDISLLCTKILDADQKLLTECLLHDLFQNLSNVDKNDKKFLNKIKQIQPKEINIISTFKEGYKDDLLKESMLIVAMYFLNEQECNKTMEKIKGEFPEE